MWPYWFIFFFPAWYALNESAYIDSTQNVNLSWGKRWWSIFIILSLVIGLRHEVGGDWLNYINQINHLAFLTWREALQNGKEVGYDLLSWLGARWGGIYFVDTLCAFIFTWGLISFCRIQQRPWLALVVSMPYLVVVVAMGYTRQGVAIGIIMLGLVALQQARVSRFVFLVAFATLFHKTAMIIIPMALIAKSKHRWLTAVGALCTLAMLYPLLLKNPIDSYSRNYIASQMASTGAGIRIAMNAVPAILFLVYRRRFVYMAFDQRKFWTRMALVAIGLIVLLNVSQSTTAVDRVALYLIPLQMVIWSQIPDALGRSPQQTQVLVFLVIFYCAMVLFVWLFFAVYASSWLPYRFYPWEALWQ